MSERRLCSIFNPAKRISSRRSASSLVQLDRIWMHVASQFKRSPADSLTVGLSSSVEKTSKPASRKKEPKIEVVAVGEDHAEDEDKETMLLSPRLQPEEGATASGTLQGVKAEKSSNALFLGLALAALIAVLALVASLGIASTA